MERIEGGGAPGVPRRAVAAAVVITCAFAVTLITTAAPGAAQLRRALATASSTPVVSPFFEVVYWESSSRKHLVRIRVLGITSYEHVIAACSACAGTHFHKSFASERATLNAAHPIQMTTKTRVLVGVTGSGAIGRWIQIGYVKHQYRGLQHGCMPPGVTSFSAPQAAYVSILPSAPCGGPCPSPPGREYVQWRGGGQVWEESGEGRQWGQYPALPVGSGQIGSAPFVVVRAGGQRDTFWRGRDGRLEEMWFSGFWSNPIELRQAGHLTSPPTAYVDGHRVEHVFWRGGNQWLYELSDPGGVWGARNLLNSGPVGSSPAVVGNAQGGESLFWKGTHGGLWEMRDTGSQTSAEPLLPAGSLHSVPAAVSDDQGVDHVFWKDGNGSLSELSDPGGHWSAPVQLPSGAMGSAPTAVYEPNGELDVFWKGPGQGLLREMWLTSGSWSGPTNIAGSGTLGSRPSAAVGRCS